MSVLLKRYLPQTVTSVILVFLILSYYFYINKNVADIFANADKALSDWAIIITSCGMIVGGVDLIRYNLLKLKKHGPRDEPFSLVAITLAIVTIMFAAIGWFYNVFIPEIGITVTTQPQFRWIYTHIFAPSSSAMFSILGFYIAVAAYKAFKVRNPPALLLLLVAIIVMLGNTTIGGLVWPGFTSLRDWIMTVPNTAAFRPITIGAGIGTIALGLRLLTWKEITWMGRRE
ncbi:MAG: hypothetical protein QW154_03620 [Sulfolobales archaeon]